MINDCRVPVLSSAIDFLFKLEPRPTLRGVRVQCFQTAKGYGNASLSEVRKEQLVGFFSCCVAAQLPRRMESMRLLVALFWVRTMDCSLPGSSVHGISQARILEQVAISFSISECKLSRDN